MFISLTIQAQVSKDMDLLSNWSTGNTPFNDVWGYVDSKGKEYAIIGSRSHYYFVNVSNPSNPQMVDGFAGGSTTVWRDMKTYSQWAYGVCDSCGEGLAIFFLGDDPSQNGVTLVAQTTQFFSRAHNIFVDEEHGRLYIIGSNTQSNGIIILDIKSNPESPTLLKASALSGGYIHDMYVRNHIGYANSGGSGLYIYDFSNVNQINNIGNLTFYPQQGYNHASWLDPSGDYLVMADETHNTSLKMLDVSDPTDIDVKSLFRSELLAPAVTGSIAHNPFIRDNYAIVSYYHDGVQIFDIDNPNNPQQVAWYDTYPNNTGYGGYSGCWGAYPYLPSGNILGSDGSTGLYVLKPTDITFTPPPTVFPPYAVLNYNGNVCIEDGEEITLSVDTDADVIQWFRNNTQVGFEDELDVSQSGTYICKVFKGPHSLVQIVEVSVGTAPDATLNVSGSYEICQGDNLMIQAPSGANSYVWLVDGQFANVFTSFFEAEEVGTYQVIVSDGDCEVLSEIITITDVISAADLSLNFNETQQICSGENILLEVASGADSYQWFRNGDPIDGATENQLMAELNGIYNVEGTLGNCTTTSDDLFVQEVASPNADLNFIGNFDLCEGDAMNLSLALGSENYDWYLNDEIVQTGEENTFIANQTGTYYAVASIADCQETSALFELEIIDSPEVSFDQEEYNTICEGEEFTFTLNGEAETYAWFFNGDLLDGVTGSSYTTSEAGAYDVFASNGDCNTNTSIVNLSVFEIPSISFNVPNNNEICEGAELNIEASTNIGTIEWFQNGMLTDETSLNFSTMTSGAIYAVLTNGECITTSETLNVNVLEQIQVSINGPSSIDLCDGESYTLESSTGASSYQWYKDGELLSTNAAVLNVSEAGMYYVIAGEGDCAGTSNTVEVIVNAQPEVSFTPLFTNNFCEGDFILLEATPGFSNYNWYKDGQLLNETSNTFNATESGNYSVEVNEENCSASASMEVSSIEKPSIDLQLESQINLCDGESINTAPIVNADSYQWYKDGQLISDAYSIQIVEAGDYYLTASNQFCQTTSETITISVTDFPNVTIIGSSNVLLCEGEETSIAVEEGADSYQWFLNGNPIGNTSEIITAESGLYYVLVGNGDCDANSQEVTVTVIDELEVSLNYAGSQTLCEGELLTLEVNDGADNYVWTNGGMSIGTNDNTLEISEPGIYMVEAFVGDCSSVSESFELIIEQFPSATLNANENLDLCEGEDFLLNVPAGADAYEWSLDGQVIPGSNINEWLANQAGTYQVSASNGDCVSFSNEIDVNYAPQLNTEIIATATSICAGDEATLTAIGDALTYSWYLNDQLIAENTINLTVSEAGQYQLVLGFGDCTAESEIITLEVLDSPVINLSQTGSLSICEGDNLDLFVEGNADNYIWLLDDVQIEEDVLNINVSQSGTYSVVAYLNGCESNTDNVVVNVQSLPDAVITANGENAICEGQSLILVANEADAYNWYFNGNLLSSNEGQLEINEAGEYYLETTSNGCSNTSMTFELIINAAPIIFLNNESDNSICTGETLLLSTDLISEEYIWLLNGEVIETNDSATLEVNQAGVYQLMASNEGCNSTSEEINLNIIDVPEISFNVQEESISYCAEDEKELSIIGEAERYSWLLNNNEISNEQKISINEAGIYQAVAYNGLCASELIEITVEIREPLDTSLDFPMGTTICEGDMATINAIIGYEFYFWTLNGDAVGTNNSTFNTTTGGTYTLTIVDGDCSQEVNFDIIVNPLPAVALEASSTEFCPGDFTTLTASIADASTYTWSRDGDVINGAEGMSLVVSEPGLYVVTVTIDGCTNSSTEIFISQYTVDLANFSIDEALLSANNGSTYQWFLNGEIIDGAIDQNYTATASGLYQVEVTDANGCTSLSEEQQVTITSIKEITSISDLNIYPNPASGFLNLSFSNPANENISIEVIDQLGQIKLNLMVKRDAFINERLTLDHLGPGLYYIRLSNQKEESLLVKFVKL